eukprot:4787755-Pyramimonas_sp.AAC.1
MDAYGWVLKQSGYPRLTVPLCTALYDSARQESLNHAAIYPSGVAPIEGGGIRHYLTYGYDP